ncbi:uncharacterized protein LOC113359704 [Papaver somniferum]|uniref:uncharacterized protein LOC113359704 n=1 Tax=Papaver somniferum TaxID=3469 RepID=UPI000E6F7841|nr:uncharacterized protein LOC113359704 [Papaver somniferum]
MVDGDTTPPSKSSENSEKGKKVADENPHLQPDSPYYVHPADNPTNVFYQPVLSGENYGTWVRGMRKSLSAKAKTGYIDGTINKPTKSADIPYWQRCDDLVGSWVCNSCEPEIGRSIMSFDTAHVMWMNLKSCFVQSNATKMYAIKQAISNLKQEDNTVAQYFTQLKTLWDQLDSFRPPTQCICHAGKAHIEQTDQDRAMEFLQGLQTRFSSLRSQLLVTEPLSSVAKLYNLVRQEEEQHGLNSLVVHNVDSAALNVCRHDPRSNRSFPGNKNGASSSNNKRQRPFYDHCNKHGHTRLICWKLVGYPKDASRSDSRALASVAVPAPAAPSITAEQYAHILALLDPANGDITPSANFAGITLSSISNSSTLIWIVDSGA